MLAGLRQQTRMPLRLELIGTSSKTTVEVMPCGVSAQDKVMNYITKTEAFAHHGATLAAPRGVWAKKSDDGKFVVLAAWRKGFNRDPFLPGKASYTFGDGSPNPTPNR